MDTGELMDSAARMVKVFLFLTLLPIVLTLRRLQVNLQPEKALGGVVVGMLTAVTLVAASACVFLSSMVVIERYNLRQ